MLTLVTLLDTLANPAKALEDLAADNGVDFKAVLADSEVSRSTFNRWKSGAFDPRLSKVRALAEGIRAASTRAAA